MFYRVLVFGLVGVHASYSPYDQVEAKSEAAPGTRSNDAAEAFPSAALQE